VKILLCCEFYYPSLGGVQVVMQQLAERFVVMGHSVTVATSRLTARTGSDLNGVHIEEFSISGNFVSGITGEIKKYHDFVLSGRFDVIMIKAAQQWTFDALWPVLNQIEAAKVFIPCGFSGLYEPAYAAYFRQMPEVLRKFDHLIFYASRYRDIDLAREHGLTNFSIIPNGASEVEFNVAADPSFRERQGIPARSFLFLTVGSFSGQKGHLELAKAFSAMTLGEGEHATLILNGNVLLPRADLSRFWDKLTSLVRIAAFRSIFRIIFTRILEKTGIRVSQEATPQDVARLVNSTQSNKRVLLTDYPRQDLIQAFMASDLFVFASNVEYSPLVLFESAAAGTPFLTVPVGNAEEIARWTEAGLVCPAGRDAKGYTRVDPAELARSMSRLAQDEALRKKLGAAGRKNWQDKFTWEKISREYEAIFLRLVEGRAANP
jgi:glycosyltransferase involved in cell wall biosynthesis